MKRVTPCQYCNSIHILWHSNQCLWSFRSSFLMELWVSFHFVATQNEAGQKVFLYVRSGDGLRLLGPFSWANCLLSQKLCRGEVHKTSVTYLSTCTYCWEGNSPPISGEKNDPFFLLFFFFPF